MLAKKEKEKKEKGELLLLLYNITVNEDYK